jgi:TolB-like protein
MIMTPKRILTLVAFSILICLCAGSLWAGEASRVAIVPFKINADRDLAFLRDGIVDMLTTRLSWEDKVVVIEKEVTKNASSTVAGTLNEKVARQIGTDLGADFVLFGSITIFGESVSLDAKMLDVHGAKPPVAVFSQSQGMDTVIPKVNSFAADINEKVFGRAISRPRETPPTPVAQKQGAPSIYAHPERLLGQTVDDQEQTSGLNPNFVVAAGRGGSAGFWKSRNFDENIKGMAIGDVDGDGKQEVVLVSQTKVFVYRNIERRFIRVAEVAGQPNNYYVSVDVADINDNGKAEIFVTNLNTIRGSLESFVLEFNGSSFVPISEKHNWYYRVFDSPARGTMLLAQKRGINDAFLKGIHELAWQNGDYESVSKLNVPKKINVFGFAMDDILNDGTEMILMLDQNDYLQILSQSGSKEWKSDEHYGGSLNYVETGSETDAKEESGQPRIYLGQRILVKDLSGDGKQEVIVVQNQGTGSRLFKRFRNYTSSQIVSLSWDGLGLAQNWKTRKIHSYVSDFAIADFDNDGQDELVAVVVTKQGVSLLVKAKSAIISYDLDIPEAS